LLKFQVFNQAYKNGKTSIDKKLKIIKPTITVTERRKKRPRLTSIYLTAPFLLT